MFRFMYESINGILPIPSIVKNYFICLKQRRSEGGVRATARVRAASGVAGHGRRTGETCTTAIRVQNRVSVHACLRACTCTPM